MTFVKSFKHIKVITTIIPPAVIQEQERQLWFYHDYSVTYDLDVCSVIPFLLIVAEMLNFLWHNHSSTPTEEIKKNISCRK